ncbi:MAG: response regulator transcription factor [Chitinophagaceae bacterium]|nr:response regulator transcription factor [Anaerolineae bacterium]
MNDRVRVLIVDDHAIVREGLMMLLAEETDFEIVGQAANGLEALKLAPVLQPDVILMDLLMPEMDGIEATRRLRQTYPEASVLVLTSFGDDQHVQSAIQAGAIGYLLKDVLKPELLQAIRMAAQKKPTLHVVAQQALMRQTAAKAEPLPHTELTERERDILNLIAQGRSNKEIAAALKLTEGTVKGYVSSVLSKLDVADRTQAALYAVKHGLVSID